MPNILDLTGEEPTAELLAKNAPVINKAYKDERQILIEVVKRAKKISRGSSGIYTENMRIYWESVLFTRLEQKPSDLNRKGFPGAVEM